MDALRCPPPDTKVDLLSGGERRRVALCRLLIQEPDILLLDEPTNHLDKATRESLMRALDQYDGTIICATHDTAILDTIATHVYEVQDGAVINTRIVEPPAPAKAQPKGRRKK